MKRLDSYPTVTVIHRVAPIKLTGVAKVTATICLTIWTMRVVERAISQSIENRAAVQDDR